VIRGEGKHKRKNITQMGNQRRTGQTTNRQPKKIKTRKKAEEKKYVRPATSSSPSPSPSSSSNSPTFFPPAQFLHF